MASRQKNCNCSDIALPVRLAHHDQLNQWSRPKLSVAEMHVRMVIGYFAAAAAIPGRGFCVGHGISRLQMSLLPISTPCQGNRSASASAPGGYA